jgi:iron complex outermembrane receptor protein
MRTRHERVLADAGGLYNSMKMPLRVQLLLAVVALGSVTQFSIVTAAWGQTAQANDSGGLTEIIVTAQRREQNVQDVAVSITAIGAEGLQALGHQDIINLSQQVPNFQAQQYSPVVTVLNIRGVSQNDVTNGEEAPIAFYNDGAYVSAMGAISGQTFDLERIEILQGPQGTLFGRNATGGAVQIITAKPTKDFQGFASVTGGSFNQVSSEAAISGPITDSIRGRLALTTNYNSNYVDNSIGPGAGNTKFYAGRAQLQADIGSGGSLLAKVEYLYNDNQSGGAYTHISAFPNALGLGYPIGDANPWNTCPGCDAFGYRAPSDPFTGSWDFFGHFSRKYWNTQIQYDQQLGFGQLTSITNWQNLWTDYAEDSDVSPNPAFTTLSWTNMYQLSQELRLAGATDRLTWLVGAYGLKIHGADWYENNALTYFGFDVNYGGDLDTRSWALFTQEEYKLNSVLSVVAGLRYSTDQKKDYYSQYTNGFLTYQFNPSTFPEASQTFDNWQGKIGLNVKPNANTLLYISANRGTKAGGFNTPLFPPADPSQMVFNQEVLWDYEAGFKLTLADNKVTLNGAAFHYQYDNYQAFSVNQFALLVTNHPGQITGAQLELAARPIAPLKLSAFVTGMFTERVEGVIVPSGEALTRDFPQNPKWSFGGSVSYEIPVQSGNLLLSTNWKYNSGQYFTAFNAPIDYEHPYAVGNVRVGFTPRNNKWELAAFVNNVTDRRYRNFDFDNSATLGSGESVFAAPRWYGGQATYRF